MENRFDLTPYILVFIRRKKALLFHLLIIAIVAWIVAFFLTKKEFKSEMVLLPPIGENAISSIVPGISLPSTSSSDIMPEQIATIFSSKSLKRKIIDKFNLYKHYKMKKNANKFENTCKILNKSLLLEGDEIGSLGFSKTISFTLCAYHTSRDTACQMVIYAFDLLDSAVKAISSGRAHQNRVFIEKQLEGKKVVLDSLQEVMRDFQIKNKAYDVPEQLKMTIKAYADVKATMLDNEIRMKAINNEFSGETPALVSLQKSNRALGEKLAQIESRENPDVMPSLESSTKLMPQYTNLMRDLEVQEQLILFVTRELEQAKIKEVKNISGLIVSDPPYVPEYKARPKRMTILLLMVGIYMIFISSIIILQETYRVSLKDSAFVKALWATLKNRET
jgi:uncharacterized protein involved in exopolysaccharide biosynthesis